MYDFFGSECVSRGISCSALHIHSMVYGGTMMRKNWNSILEAFCRNDNDNNSVLHVSSVNDTGSITQDLSTYTLHVFCFSQE